MGNAQWAIMVENHRFSCLPIEGKVASQVTDEVETELIIIYLGIRLLVISQGSLSALIHLQKKAENIFVLCFLTIAYCLLSPIHTVKQCNEGAIT